MLPKEENCSGCGACANVCPVDAIKMKYSFSQFLIPVIDNEKCINCGKCEAICPVLKRSTVNAGNLERPRFYAFCAEDDIRKLSSSGGVFTLLSNYVFEKNGYVCGAAFDENFQLSHEIIDSSSELDKFRGSKYLQSNTKDCYRRIKKLLDDGQYVLFSGTPCQVAGLYACMGKNYEKLITIDLLCHGTPSQKFFDSYLKEVSKGKKVKKVSFRNKRFGWSFSHILTEFADNTEHIGKYKGNEPDSYANAFMENMMMRRLCYDCKFSSYPRQGDFTIGDLWHSDKLDPKSNDKKGTSFVFVNNDKAEIVLSEIAKYAKYVNEIFVDDYTKIPNRVNAKAKPHPNRRRFIDLIKKKSFSEAYSYAKSGKYDIGMCGYMCTPNIGSVLTYYALYNVLTEMGYTVKPIERPLDAPYEVSEDAVAFVKKWLPMYSQPIQYDSILEMRKLNDICEKFVVGSDQIYLQSSSKSRKDYCFTQWADENKLKIAYATSFGGPGARGTKEFYNELKYYLNRFTKISCRENDGVKFANETLKLNTRVEMCIDPVFLANKAIYIKLIKSVNVDRTSEFVGGYVINPRQGVYSLINKAKKHFGGLLTEIIGEMNTKEIVEKWGFNFHPNFPIENSLETIFNSKFFVTDSYHGVCFCIIFKKDFLVIPRDFPDRFTTLLGKIGLEDRIIKNDHSNLSDKAFSPIDWDAVYEKLNIEIGISRYWLTTALDSKKKEFSYTDFDILMEYIRKQNEEICELKKELKQIKEQEISKET